MTTTIAPQCMYCKHYRRDATKLVCDAYPDGIPDAILYWKVDHRAPYRGDNGIRFEPAEQGDEEAVKDRWRMINEAKQRKALGW